MHIWFWILSCYSEHLLPSEKESVENTDQDNDGYTIADDCNDEVPNIHPNAPEICDGLDNNCDGQIDEDVTITFYLDEAEDGFGNAEHQIEACIVLDGYTNNGSDCDDGDAHVYPGAEEQCDDLDNDCDGDIDEDIQEIWFFDEDGDGYGDDLSAEETCVLGSQQSMVGGDCDDVASDINPIATEVCDYLDNNCDGDIDEPSAIDAPTWYIDSDGDGEGSPDTSQNSCSSPIDYSANANDCDDSDASVALSAVEICDGTVNICGGLLPEVEIDDDGDGFVECTIDT